MDDLEAITDEERALAEEFAKAVDSGEFGEEDAGAIALLKSAESWEARKGPLARTREDVLKWAETADGKRVSERRFPRWLVWLPLPAVGAMALAVSMKTPSADAPSASVAPPRADVAGMVHSDATKGRWHEGELPNGLLRAQAELLAAKSARKPFDRSQFDQEMQRYRATLLARVEMEGSR